MGQFSGRSPRSSSRSLLGLVLLVGILGSVWTGPVLGDSAGGDRQQDSYLQGYAAAVVEREFSLRPASLHVERGIIHLEAAHLGVAEKARLRQALGAITGVRGVEIHEPTSPPPPPAEQAAGGETSAEPHPSDETVESHLAPKVAASLPSGADPLPAGSGADEVLKRLFPTEKLYQPMLADPRWPHFSASYNYYTQAPHGQSVGAVSFGETFAFWHNDAPFGGRWSPIIQAGVFAIFDLNSPSLDLVNADYFVALGSSHRWDDFSVLLRAYHQSSHIGDEFLIRNGVTRVNLTYEVLDAKLSYDLTDQWRVYGGGGWLFDQEPEDLKAWLTQLGVEYRGPAIFFDGLGRPVAAVDVQMAEEHDWEPGVSVRTGLQIESPRSSRKVLLLLEYYHGHSPNGQFYPAIVEYLGFGVHFYF
ncbi:MAG: DUF1207 domain-containing protein [Phycisphaeraceae bacterium]|nr:DUF1207 domain-containing protein [Phycisphaeraceae bacterium]